MKAAHNIWAAFFVFLVYDPLYGKNMMTRNFIGAFCISIALIGCTHPKTAVSESLSKPSEIVNETLTKPNIDMKSVRYWVTRPGHPVYNSGGDIVRSQRLQPSVMIYKRKDGRGLISLEKDEWINFSDVALEKPDHFMIDPKNETGLPRVNLPKTED